HVLDCCDGQTNAEHLVLACSLHEWVVPFVGLDLYAQVAAFARDVNALREAFDTKSRSQRFQDSRQVRDSNHQIEIKTHHWLRIRVHGLAVNHAISSALFREDCQQSIEEVSTVGRHGSQKGPALHCGFSPEPM